MKTSQLKTRTPLRCKTCLKSHKPINRVSKKQARINHELSTIDKPPDNRCQDCGNLPDFRGLQKHHKIFRSKCGNNNPDNLIWLCGKCHSKAHGIKETT